VNLAETAPRAVVALERVQELTRRYEAAEQAEMGLADPVESTRLQRRIDALWKFADQLSHAHLELWSRARDDRLLQRMRPGHRATVTARGPDVAEKPLECVGPTS
jgi:hypothetical protein